MYRSHDYWPDEADEEALFNWRRSRAVTIGHDTWIGHGVVVMKDVKIGTGAVVASQAVVTKDVPAYAIVGGIPAKFIKWRHPEAIAERLQALAWWDWSHQQLRQALPDFRRLQVEEFLDKYEGEAAEIGSRADGSHLSAFSS